MHCWTNDGTSRSLVSGLPEMETFQFGNVQSLHSKYVVHCEAMLASCHAVVSTCAQLAWHEHHWWQSYMLLTEDESENIWFVSCQPRPLPPVHRPFSRREEQFELPPDLECRRDMKLVLFNRFIRP